MLKLLLRLRVRLFEEKNDKKNIELTILHFPLI